MMIDQNQTPLGEETQKPDNVAEQASETTEMANPSNDMTDAQTNSNQETSSSDNANQGESAEKPNEQNSQESSTPPAETPPAVTPTSDSGTSEKKTTTEAPQPLTQEEDADLFEAALTAMETGEDVDSLEGSFKKLQKGDRIEATVIQVDSDRVFVDLGTKSEGIVPLAELSEGSIESPSDHFKIGDKINVVVLRPEGAEGNPIVSKRRADFEAAWDRIEESFKAETMITAQVIDRVKGGLVVDVGVRGFVPATHVGSGKLRNIEKFVGQPLQLKVIEIDRDRKKVVLSNRQAEEERRQKAKQEIFSNVNPGDTLEGTVRRLTDYGAFVDLGGVDGLLHISEMSWMRISHPKEMFKEGQKIKVMVLRLDPDAGKISLGHRQVLPDPWNLIRENYTVGQKLTVTIGRLVQSGAFVKLPEGAEAFLPVSEMSHRRIKRPEDAIEENQEVEVQIIDLRPDERRMVLSIRATGAFRDERGGGGYGGGGGMPMVEYGDDARPEKRSKKKGKRGGRNRDMDDDFEESIGRRGFATGGATIGERLGMLKGFLSRDDEEDLEEALVEDEVVADEPVAASEEKTAEVKDAAEAPPTEPEAKAEETEATSEESSAEAEKPEAEVPEEKSEEPAADEDKKESQE